MTVTVKKRAEDRGNLWYNKDFSCYFGRLIVPTLIFSNTNVSWLMLYSWRIDVYQGIQPLVFCIFCCSHPQMSLSLCTTDPGHLRHAVSPDVTALSSVSLLYTNVPEIRADIRPAISRNLSLSVFFIWIFMLKVKRTEHDDVNWGKQLYFKVTCFMNSILIA